MKGIGTAFIVATSLLLIVIIGIAAANLIEALQMPLNPAGSSYELNLDQSSNLIITDGDVGEIWLVVPSTSVTSYTVYHNAFGAVDAHADSAGNMWWVDYGSVIGRYHDSSDQITLWTFPGLTTLSGLTIDDTDRVWAVNLFPDADVPQVLYRLDLSVNQVCSYTFGGRSEYVLHDSGKLWLGDWTNDRIGRLDPVSNEYTYWQLPGEYNSWPGGMALDESGRLWWADRDVGTDALATLDPVLSLMTYYTLPVGTDPQMVAVDGVSVWYTEQGMGTVGQLDPSAATGISTTLTSSTTSVTPTCVALSPGTTFPSSKTTGTANWSGLDMTLLMENEGWRIYELPENGSPWGISYVNDAAWVVDRGRQQLLSIAEATPPPQNPAIQADKVLKGNADEDGSLDVSIGDTLSYSITATNIGDVTLTTVIVDDDLTGTSNAACAASLAPGESCTVLVDYIVIQADVDAGQIDNIGSVEGTDPSNDPISDFDDESVPVPQSPAIQAEKVLKGNADEDGSLDVSLGDTLSYSITAANIGNVTLTSVTIDDDLTGAIDAFCAGSLAPGESCTVVVFHVVTQADAQTGQIDNTGTVEGVDPNDNPLSDSDAESVSVSPTLYDVFLPTLISE